MHARNIQQRGATSPPASFEHHARMARDGLRSERELRLLDRVFVMTGAARVLVVDDNPENRALAQATLDDEDIACTVVSNGEDALAAFEREKPDCVLLDIRMPGLDGIEVCQRIRALPGGDLSLIHI